MFELEGHIHKKNSSNCSKLSKSRHMGGKIHSTVALMGPKVCSFDQRKLCKKKSSNCNESFSLMTGLAWHNTFKGMIVFFLFLNVHQLLKKCFRFFSDQRKKLCGSNNCKKNSNRT